MKRRLPMSALITGLLAAPVLGTAPVMAEARVPLVEPAGVSAEFPGEMPVEVGERMRRWSRGERPDAFGMQALQRRMLAGARQRMARALAGEAEPAMPSADWTQARMYPVQFMLADQLDAELAQKEKAAFLGVKTSAVDASLRGQLGLARGMGLIVEYVEKESPADAAGLKMYDVLQKLDDQLLVNEQQLQVLVRAKKPGDTIQLTVIRGGKPVTLSAKLVEREVVVLEQMPSAGTRVASAPEPMPGTEVNRTMTREVTGSSVTINADGSMVRRVADGQHDITLNKAADGKETVSVKDREGRTLYEGAVEGMEKAGLAAEVVKQVQSLEQQPNQMTIHLGAGAGGAGTAGSTYMLSRDDGEYSITLRREAGAQKVAVLEKGTGKVIYEGTGSEADLKAMTPAVAEKVKALLEKAK